MIRLPCVFLLLILALLSASAFAHESRPILLEIKEIQLNTFSVLWKSPAGGLMRGVLYPVYPESCVEKNIAAADYSYANVNKHILHCNGGLAGLTISINDLEKNIGVSALVRISFLSGQSHTNILLNSSSDYRIPEKENKASIIHSYTLLGIKHILLGTDHLLFIFCLLLMTRGYKLLLWTITGFTLAHSVSLVASVLNLVRLPAAFVETCIALSIMFLAAEILRGNKVGLSFRKPFLISALFGLFHGFGFADVLLGIGLPQTDMGLGLLFFNLGVELGQIVFILGLLLSGILIQTVAGAFLWHERQPVWYAQRILCPAIGSISAFWVFQGLGSFV
jgi:hydrogenase/urease accessory protein HupE